MASDFKWDDFKEEEPAVDEFSWDSFAEVSPAQAPILASAPINVAEPESEPSSDASIGESLQRGVGQGLSMGLGDELGGAIQSGADAIYGMFGDSPTEVNKRLAEQGFTGDVGPTSSSEMYSTARDEERAANRAAEEANPYSYRGSELFGSILSGVGTGAAGARSLAGLGKLAIPATMGAEGAVQALGYSESEDPTSLGQEALTGGALGAGLGLVLPPAARLAGRVASKSIPTAVGAGLGGITGYAMEDDDASMSEKLESAGLGALAGGAAGGAAHLMGKGAQSLLKMENLGSTIKGGFREGMLGKSLSNTADRQSIITETGIPVQKLATKIQKNVNTLANKAEAAEAKIAVTEKQLLDNQEQLARATTKAEEAKISRKIESKAKELVDLVDDVKKTAAEAIDKSYDALDKSGMIFNGETIVDDALAEARDLMGKSAGTQDQAFLMSALEDIKNGMRGSTGTITDARKLKNTIKSYVDAAPNNNVARVLSDAYKNVNNSIINQAKEQGFGELADSLAKGNNSYYSAKLADMSLGDKFTRGVDVDPRLIKTSSLLQGMDAAQGKAGGTLVLDKVQQELERLAPGRAAPIFEDASKLSQMKEALATPKRAQLAEAIKPQVESTRNALMKEAAPNIPEAAATDITKLVGPQKELSDQVVASPGLQDWSRRLTREGGANKQVIKDKVSTMLGDEAPELMSELEKASRRAELIEKTAPKDITSTGGGKAQILASLGGVGQSLAIRAANVLGIAAKEITDLTGGNLTKTILNSMDKASPEVLQSMSALVADKAPEAARRIGALSAMEDPIKRKATLFMLNQDPAFRNLFKDDEEMDMEGAVVNPE